LHPTKETTYPAFQRDKENSAALCYNPYTVRHIGEFDDGTIKFIAAEYNLARTVPSLFLAATKHLDCADSAHILNTNQDAPGLRLYYRTYSDAYHALIDNQGILEMPTVTLELTNPEKHAAATLFQEKHSKVLKPLAKSLRMIDVSEENVTCRVRELSHVSKDVFLQMIETFKVSSPSEYEHIVQDCIAQIKQTARHILENEGRLCRSAIKYNEAWDYLLKNTQKI
jgi:hypothetical protein